MHTYAHTYIHIHTCINIHVYITYIINNTINMQTSTPVLVYMPTLMAGKPPSQARCPRQVALAHPQGAITPRFLSIKEKASPSGMLPITVLAPIYRYALPHPLPLVGIKIYRLCYICYALMEKIFPKQPHGRIFPEHSYSVQVLPHLKNENLKENSEN